MPLELVSHQSPENPFEKEVLDALGRCKLDGIRANNILLPHLKHRSLPNEHDILVLVAGRVYTIDAKGLYPGHYRGAASGAWEYSETPDGEFRACAFLDTLGQVAFKKRNVAVEYLTRAVGKNRVPDVVAVIVVPDGADLSQMERGPDGTDERGARSLLVQKSELCAALEADAARPGGYPLTMAELAEAFKVRTPTKFVRFPCHLNDQITLEAFVEGTQRPFPRNVYRGVYRPESRLAEKAWVRVEVTAAHAVANVTLEQDAVFRAFRNNLSALRRIRHEAALQHVVDYDTPLGLISVTEWFSDLTLAARLRTRLLAWPEARIVFRAVVGLLDAAHTAEVRIVHRYLDPTCVLLREGPGGAPVAVRVGGFFGAVVGTLSTAGIGPTDNPYLDPTARGEHKNAPAQDYYSVGRCLAYALTGATEAPALPAGGAPAELPAVLRRLTAPDHIARADGWAKLREMLGLN